MNIFFSTVQIMARGSQISSCLIDLYGILGQLHPAEVPDVLTFRLAPSIVALTHPGRFSTTSELSLSPS